MQLNYMQHYGPLFVVLVKPLLSIWFHRRNPHFNRLNLEGFRVRTPIFSSFLLLLHRIQSREAISQKSLHNLHYIIEITTRQVVIRKI